MKEKFLEDIVKEEHSKIEREPGSLQLLLDNPLTRHPIATGLGVFITIDNFGSYLYKFVDFLNVPGLPKLSSTYSDDRAIGISTGYLLYLACSTIKQYYLEKASLKLKVGKTLTDRIYNWILDNPKATVLAAVAANLLLLDASKNTIKASAAGFDYSYIRGAHLFFVTPLLAVASEALIKGLRNTKRIKKAIKKIKTKTSERIWNYVFEHPIALGSIIGAYNLIDSYLHVYKNQKTSARSQGLSWFGLAGTVSLLSAVVPIFAITTTGSLLHTHSLRSLKYKITSTYYDITGNKEKAIEQQEKLANLPDSLERRIENLIDLGNLCYSQGNEPEAFKCYRKAARLFDKKDTASSYLEFFRKTFGITKIIRRIKRSGKNNLYSSFIDLLNKDQNAINRLKILLEDDQNNYRIRYLYGKALDILGFKISGRLQKLQAAKQCLHKGVDIRYLSGSKRKVYLFNDNFLGEEIIAKENATEEPLKREVDLTSKVREAIAEHEDYEAALPIGIAEVDNKYWYIMEQAEGELLRDKIKNKTATLAEFLQIADFLGLFHARIDPSEASQERDYIHVMQQRLVQYGVDLDLVSRVCNNMHPIIENIGAVRKVHNKDAHPGNWVTLNYGGIMMLDIESSRLVPLTLDTATLTSYHTYLSLEDQERVLEAHRKAFKKYTKEDVNKEEFRLAYLSSIILTAVEIYNREFIDKETRLAILKNASTAIETISSEFPMHYQQHKREYENLNYSTGVLALALVNLHASTPK